jgi:septum formation protein
MRLILASSSPRRAELLRAAGLPFLQIPANVDETIAEGEGPERAVLRLARDKALSVSSLYPEDIVLGADTLVVLEGHPLGKPRDVEDAAEMLRRLSGQTHEVLTGICVCHRGGQLASFERTRVRMASLDDKDIRWYVDSGEPLDKAGAYAIQGLASRFVESLEGSYSNVVGLPVSGVCALLKRVACDILGFEKLP